MNVSTIRSRTAPWVALFAVAGLIAALVTVFAPAPAQGAPRLSVSSELGGVTAATAGPTRFDLQGSGFQVIDGGFGGVYIAFGWVNERTWRPSQGGKTGSDYRYVPDSETRGNQGYLGFIAFPGSSTEGEAHGTFSSSGSFSLSLNVPGARFTSQDRNGHSVTVDCTQVTCGFLTFGAHGVKNANNETFVPVNFQAGGEGNAGGGGNGEDGEQATGGGGVPAAQAGEQSRGAAQRPQGGTAQPRVRAGAQQGASGGRSASAGGGADASGGEAAEGEAEEGEEGSAVAAGGGSATGEIEITVDRASARPGGALSYTAYGFWPGEQATVSLGDGLAAVGPLTTGIDGEIAGVLTLPDDMEAGTYEVRAVGAGSGLEGSQRFAVSDVGLLSSEGALGKFFNWEWLFLVIAALVFLGAIGYVVYRRKSANSEEASDSSGEFDGTDAEGSSTYSDPSDEADDYYGSQSRYTAHSGY